MSLWNGHRAALSLTFDDALQCQLEYAVPVMNAHDIQGTFFAITNCPQYPLDVHGWRKAIPYGHEIGSHSVLHRKAATLNVNDANFETRESKRMLENHFDVPVYSFCYPYTDAPSLLQNAVQQAGYKQARGGRGARQEKCIRPRDGVNLFNTPCYHVDNACLESGIVYEWILDAIALDGWTTLMFHGIGTDGNQWDNVFPHEWSKFMLHLQKAKENGLWVAPYGTVADNLRGNK